MTRTQELLKKSIQAYEDILRLECRLEETLMQEDSPETAPMTHRLEKMQAAARLVDGQLLESLSGQRPDRPEEDLFRQRNQILEKVLAKQNQILALAKVKKALVAEDLHSVRQGRTGLAGYQSQIDRPAGSFNKAY